MNYVNQFLALAHECHNEAARDLAMVKNDARTLNEEEMWEGIAHQRLCDLQLTGILNAMEKAEKSQVLH